jgi:hypothetical protein
MNKETAHQYILSNMEPDDNLVGFFIAQGSFPLLWCFIIGPLAILMLKQYYVAFSEKGVYFIRLNLLGKPSNTDLMLFSEIENVKIGKGMLQRPMLFRFTNGKKLKIKAQIKGVKKVATLKDDVQQHLERNVQTV